jgi:fibronectin type 3 domain-containing protein
VSNGVVYHYWISAMDNGNNESALSPGTLATPADAPPARPLRLTATAGFRKVELNWPRSAEPDLSHYVLYRNTVSSFTPTISDTIATIPAPDTSFTDTKVSNGVTYYYRVSAVDTLGMESGVSPETSAQPSGPTAVTLVSIAAEETFGMVHLSWQTASERNHAGFQLLRGPSAQGPFQTINATLIQPWKPGHYLFIDKEVEINRVYTYLLQSVATDGQVETVHTLVVTVQPPRTFELAQNYPNPFNPETTIRYALAGPSHVTVTVYNMAGQTIRTLVEQHQAIGFYTVRWDGRNSYGEPVASGVYLYRIQAGDFSSVRKMLLIK